MGNLAVLLVLTVGRPAFLRAGRRFDARIIPRSAGIMCEAAHTAPNLIDIWQLKWPLYDPEIRG